MQFRARNAIQGRTADGRVLSLPEGSVYTVDDEDQGMVDLVRQLASVGNAVELLELPPADIEQTPAAPAEPVTAEPVELSEVEVEEVSSVNPDASSYEDLTVPQLQQLCDGRDPALARSGTKPELIAKLRGESD